MASTPPRIGSLLNTTFMSLMNLVLYTGFAYLPVFILESSLLDTLSESIVRVNPDESFDFIIVGGGTAGLVVANRLSADGEKRVLLLEAGGEPNILMMVPGAASLFPNNDPVDWMFRTVPQKYSSLSLNNQSSLWPRGKGLGGTSNLNFLAYLRGHPKDYDTWAEITKNNQWNYSNLIEYFKKSENFVDPYNEGKPYYHGTGGDLQVEPANFNPLAPYFVRAAQELGYSKEDLNAPFDEGFSQVYFTIKDGFRQSSNQAFLQPIRGRENLTIRKFSIVSKILFDERNRAVGVQYKRFKRNMIARARNEIILSAGTIGSAKILLLSGIGPKNDLENLGIRVISDLPVGENLMDHVIGLVGPFTINKPLTFVPDRDGGVSTLTNYVLTGNGPLSATGISATGFFQSSLAKKESEKTGKIHPDSQLILLGLSLHEQGPQLLASLYNLKPQIAEEYYRPVASKDIFHIMSVGSRPRSRGFIKLASAKPDIDPIIDPKYLEHPDDFFVILEGMQKALQLVENSTAFQKIGAKLSATPFPSCKHLEFRSQQYWECYLREFSLSVYHPCGTCAMNSVVDSNLKVKNVQGLRVVDASVFPTIPINNIQATIYAVSELGSKLILDDNN